MDYWKLIIAGAPWLVGIDRFIIMLWSWSRSIPTELLHISRYRSKPTPLGCPSPPTPPCDEVALPMPPVGSEEDGGPTLGPHPVLGTPPNGPGWKDGFMEGICPPRKSWECRAAPHLHQHVDSSQVENMQRHSNPKNLTLVSVEHQGLSGKWIWWLDFSVQGIRMMMMFFKAKTVLANFVCILT